MNKKNNILRYFVILISFLLLNGNSYSQNTSFTGQLFDEDYEDICFSSVSYSYLDLTGKALSNTEGCFSIDNLKIGDSIKLHIAAIGYSYLDTFIAISMDTIFLFLKYPSIIEGEYINKELAESDIKKNNIRIITTGGNAPPMYRYDSDFEKKYNLKFWTNGDQYRVSNKRNVEYNAIIFGYLDSKYGKKWRTEIRPDVLNL